LIENNPKIVSINFFGIATLAAFPRIAVNLSPIKMEFEKIKFIILKPEPIIVKRKSCDKYVSGIKISL
tara:strand:- start:215 stop:418 length:204 start_codon:yes stop_codon:yes gene_type:complete